MSKKKTHRKPGATTAKPAQSGGTHSAGTKKTASATRKSARRSQTQSGSRRWLWYALGVGAILLIIAAGAFSLTRQPAQPAIVQISPDQAYQKFQAGAYILDVRSQAEWEEIHIPDSTLIPLDELSARLEELPQDREIVVVCLVGKRSQAGQKLLASSGFEDAYCLDGGIQAWEAAGYPTESSG